MYEIDHINNDYNEVWGNLALILPYLKPWLKQQRWAGLSNIEKFDLELGGDLLIFKEEENLQILGFFPAIVAPNIETRFFLPLIFYLDKKEIVSSPEVIIKTNEQEIYISQAECSFKFIKLLLEDLKQSKIYNVRKTLKFGFELIDEQFLSNFNLKEAKTFKKGETTNFLTKIIGKKRNIFLKSYRKFSMSREPLLIRELFRIKFKHIPKTIGFAKKFNGKEQICFYFQEFIPFDYDLGHYFWEYLNHRMEHPDLHQVALINHAHLNKDLLTLADLMVNFHQKSYNLKHDLFKKQIFTKEDIKRFKDSQSKIMNEILRKKSDDLDIFNNISKKFDKIQKNLVGLEKFIGLHKITVHQDLHLAQILVTIDKDQRKSCYITDFEGDPNRPNNELWERDLIFRDLASIITAFYYIKINSIIQKNGISIASLKEIELFSHKSSVIRSQDTFFIARDYTTYVVDNFIKFYYDKFDKIKKEIDFNIFKEGCNIYKLDRLLREIYYELKFRKGNYVIPLTILNMILAI